MKGLRTAKIQRPSRPQRAGLVLLTPARLKPYQSHAGGHGVKNTVHYPEAAKTAGKRAERARQLLDRWLKKQPAPQPVKSEGK